MVFSGFVLICDGFTLYQVYVNDDLKLLDDIYGINEYTFSKVTIGAILTVDGLAVLFSGLNFFVVLCLAQKHCQGCTHRCFSCFIFMCFCRKHKMSHSKDEVDSERKHQEYILWLLLASFIAPIVCVGTHSSFVIMAWTSDYEQANSMTVVFILSFTYYFLGFRQLYIIFAQGCCVKCKVNTRFSCCCKDFSNEHTSLLEEIGLYYRKNLEHLNFKVLVCESIFILRLLMSVEALVVLAYYFLPVPVITVPSNVLSIFHLTFLIGTGLIAYKFLKANVAKSGSSKGPDTAAGVGNTIA